MQRAGNLIRVLAVPLRAEVLTLHRAQTNFSLCCCSVNRKSANFSVEATVPEPSRESAPCPTSSLVSQFTCLSVANNPRVDQDVPDLSPFADALEENLTLLTFDQLQDLVHGLTLWPEARRTSTILKQVSYHRI